MFVDVFSQFYLLIDHLQARPLCRAARVSLPLSSNGADDPAIAPAAAAHACRAIAGPGFATHTRRTANAGARGWHVHHSGGGAALSTSVHSMHRLRLSTQEWNFFSSSGSILPLG